jgi:hypothetical protein
MTDLLLFGCSSVRISIAIILHNSAYAGHDLDDRLPQCLMWRPNGLRISRCERASKQFQKSDLARSRPMERRISRIE